MRSRSPRPAWQAAKRAADSPYPQRCLGPGAQGRSSRREQNSPRPPCRVDPAKKSGSLSDSAKRRKRYRAQHRPIRRGSSANHSPLRVNRPSLQGPPRSVPSNSSGQTAGQLENRARLPTCKSWQHKKPNRSPLSSWNRHSPRACSVSKIRRPALPAVGSLSHGKLIQQRPGQSSAPGQNSASLSLA